MMIRHAFCEALYRRETGNSLSPESYGTISIRGLRYALIPAVSAILMALIFATSARADEPVATPAPKFGPAATRLFFSQEYVRTQPAPDYWSLSPYYLPQMNGKSCSVTAVAMVVNGARATHSLGAADELATEKGILERLQDTDWTAATTGEGFGVKLDLMGPRLVASLAAYGVQGASTETVHADADGFAETLHTALVENEASTGDFIVANFMQSSFTGDPEGAVGHYAPIAAYDAVNARALIMDPDRTWYEPYWVSEATLLEGMRTLDSGGMQYRGFVRVKLAK